MKTKKFILFLALTCSSTVYVQSQQDQPVIYNNIKSAQDSGKQFEQVEKLIEFSKNEIPEGVEKSIKLFNVTTVDFDHSQLPEGTSLIELELPTTDGNVSLLLMEHFMEPYQLRENRNETTRESSKGRHFRGIVKGEPNSIVSLSFFEEEVMGMVSISQEETFTLGKVFGTNQHIVFKGTGFGPQGQNFCATNIPTVSKSYSSSILYSSNTTESSSRCVQLYFETEFDIYQNLGSLVAVENYVNGLFNQVATIFANESINVEISEITIWTTADPYTGTNAGSVLTQFQQNTGAFNGDLGQLLTFRNIGGGIAAGFNGLCNSNSDLSLSVSGGLETTVPPVPTYSWSVMVVTHEFGHLFGSRHTHACVWNGNSTAIDGCSPFTEGGCPSPGLPTVGTIMSYCHITAVGIDFNAGFGLQPGNVIRNRVTNANCLNQCENLCLDPCSLDAEFSVTSQSNCIKEFSASNPLSPGCEDEYDYSWTIQGVLGTVGTSQQMTYDFSNMNNGYYNVTLTMSYQDGGLNCTDSEVMSVYINCGINQNPTCPPSSAISLSNEGGGGSCTGALAYMSTSYQNDIASINWHWALAGYTGNAQGNGFVVPIYYPSGNWTNYYLVVYADITFENGSTCTTANSFLLDCGSLGGGSAITVFPNPSQGTFSIKTNSGTAIKSVDVINTNGNVIRSISEREASKEINLQNQESGVYLLKVTLENGESVYEKLIIE